MNISNYKFFASDQGPLRNQPPDAIDGSEVKILQFVSKARLLVPQADRVEIANLLKELKEMRTLASSRDNQLALEEVIDLIDYRLNKQTSRGSQDSSTPQTESARCPSHDALQAPKPRRAVETGMPRPFCGFWERLSALHSDSRKELQNCVENLEVHFFFQPPLRIISDVFMAKTYEERKALLDEGSLVLAGFLAQCIPFLQKVIFFSESEESSAHAREIPSEVKRMLNKILEQVWGKTNAVELRHIVRSAWLSVHPDKNNNQAPLELDFSSMGRPDKSEEEARIQRYVNECKNGNARNIMAFLTLVHGLCRSGNLLERSLDKDREERDRAMDCSLGTLPGFFVAVKSVGEGLATYHAALAPAAWDARLAKDALVEEKTQWKHNALYGARRASTIHVWLTGFLGRGPIDYAATLSMELGQFNRRNGLSNVLLSFPERSFLLASRSAVRTLSGDSNLSSQASGDWRVSTINAASSFGKSILTFPGIMASVLVGCTNLFVGFSLCALGGLVGFSSGMVRRVIPTHVEGNWFGP